jgi:hypothetical protein
MGSIVAGVANDLASGLLQFYVREEMLSQTTQEKPVLKAFTEKSETFPGGLGQVSVPVQGVYMSDTAGFFAGYSEDDQLSFAQAQNMLRANYNYKEHHAGLVITWSELKKDGITISDGNRQKEHSKTDLVRLTSVMKNRLADFGESWARATEDLFWQDGSQDAKAMPGITSMVFDDPTVGAVGGLDPATYVWWRNRASLGIAPSAENQTLVRTMTRDDIQIRRFGGKIDLRVCGSAFRDAVELEVRGKGNYTLEGWNSRQDISMGDFVLNGVMYKYEPWLDDHARSKYCYGFDTRRLKLRPMEGEMNKIVTPERPYNFMVFLRSMTLTAAMQSTQRNAIQVTSVA